MAEPESLADKLGDCAERKDFAGAFALVKDNLAEVDEKLSSGGVGGLLKRSTDDRLALSLVEGAEFGKRPLAESVGRLDRLMSFTPDTLVLNKSWGVGRVRKVDPFYGRITVDFKTKRGHSFTYAAAADMLEPAPDDHILVLREKDPAAFDAMLKKQPGELVKAVLRANGSSMTQVRLEDWFAANGFVRQSDWKAFWAKARPELSRDPCVAMPSKKADPIVLRSAAENYGDGWLTAFAHETDPKAILSAVREYAAQGRFKTAGEDVRAKIGERLAFAATAARKTDDALFAQIAAAITSLGYAEPTAESMRGYLWSGDRYVKAAATLPARDVGTLVSFMADGPDGRARLYADVPKLCFAAVVEVAERFGEDAACREAFGAMMKEPKAPATLTTLLAGRYEKFSGWTELPPLIVILSHAIALGEGRQSGETLKMQNIVRRLFADKAWLAKIFSLLDEPGRKIFFERFQASISWDPSTHHATVVRMTKIEPSLEPLLAKAEKKRETPRTTSPRSFALRKAEYLKLVNEDMPANVRRIEFAKGFGDLSENAEYQYAKDEQRALMQKQSVMQAELEAVKPAGFDGVATDEVAPGVTVVCDTPDGEKTWTILGEWDNDLEKGVISSKTRVAQNLLGKKPGDSFELPDAEGGSVTATVREIRPLSDEIRAWMQVPEGMQI